MTANHRVRTAIAACLAIAAGALAAGCSSSTSSSPSTTSSTASPAAASAPIVIAYPSIQTGVYATPAKNNDIELAVKTINAQGGVDGHQLKYVAYDAGITPEQAVTATQQLLGTKPTAIIGYQVDAQVQAVAQVLKQSGIPTLSDAQGPAAGSPAVKVPNLFTIVPNLVNAIQGGTTYGFSKYHPTSVGIFHTDDTASTEDANVAQALLKKDGVKNFTVRSASQTATDVTQQALAMKGTNVVFEYGFPTVEAAFNTALQQNGVTAPIMGDQSGNFLAAYGLNKPSELTGYAYTPYCGAQVLTTPAAKSYMSAYEAAFPGQSVLTTTPYIYDAVYLIAQAVKDDGGNLSASAINRELGSLTYSGACGTYHSDANHDTIHQVVVISYANGTNPGTLVAHYTEPPVASSYFTGSGG